MITKLYTHIDSLFQIIRNNFKDAYSFNEQNFKEEVKNDIDENQLEKAIKKCKEIIRTYSNNQHLENEILNLLRRIKQLEKEKRLGIIPDDEYEAEKTDIIDALRVILKKIKLPHKNRLFLYLKLLLFPIGCYLTYLFYFFIFPPTFEVSGFIFNKNGGVPSVKVWSNINGTEVSSVTDKDGVFSLNIREDYIGNISFKFSKDGPVKVGDIIEPHQWKGKKKISEMPKFFLDE